MEEISVKNIESRIYVSINGKNISLSISEAVAARKDLMFMNYNVWEGRMWMRVLCSVVCVTYQEAKTLYRKLSDVLEECMDIVRIGDDDSRLILMDQELHLTDKQLDNLINMLRNYKENER